MVEIVEVTARQEKAIAALINETTVARAARTSGIGLRTLHRWLVHDPAFRAAYRSARREAFGQAVALTQRYAPLAVTTLAQILSDPSAPHTARVSAAAAILRFGRDGIELDDLADRVEALERAQREGSNA
ncbi:MAG: hypothetical protein DYG93_07740 [Leptolyngbya sp. PLA2]|nr:hypothetical protein [Leptolyngbya sp.]MCE7971539.1 hypothetical protein [Leptolyngbya sp. PL-A2]MCQ3940753.1 hypothetical protein [cyanobacterium CYA1]MDL1903723.1 hypothetical protein [Synechococcales cyanobacterium CNB]